MLLYASKLYNFDFLLFVIYFNEFFFERSHTIGFDNVAARYSLEMIILWSPHFSKIEIVFSY